MKSPHDSGRYPLDDLLELDPEPTFSPEARMRLMRRLADARLDGYLDADHAVPPSGLSDRVLTGVRSAMGPEAGSDRSPTGSSSQSGSQLRSHGRSKRRLPMAFPLAAAAAAALAIWTLRGGWTAPDVDDAREVVVVESEEEVSDELLASLSVLENFEFLTEELDPLESDALFLLSGDDQLLLDLLDAEADTGSDTGLDSGSNTGSNSGANVDQPAGTDQEEDGR